MKKYYKSRQTALNLLASDTIECIGFILGTRVDVSLKIVAINIVIFMTRKPVFSGTN